MWIKFKGRIKSQRIIDRAKLNYALFDAINGNTNKDINKIDRRWAMMIELN